MIDERLHVHILHAPPRHAFDTLLDAIDKRIDVSIGPDVPRDTAVLVAGRPSPEQLDASPQLRTLIIPYAGVPDATRKLLLAEHSGLEVYNLHHNAAAAAEIALALLLAAAKTLIPVDRRFREHDWRSRYEGAPTLLLDGKRALILGLGAIGTRIAAACHALGMKVTAIRAHQELPHPEFADVHGPQDLHRLLPCADALLIAIPLTDQSLGLIGERELSALPSHAILVNVARGPIVVEEALYRALVERRIGAAGIDVWYRYPETPEQRASAPPSRFPFNELENVVMSPHRGGAFHLEELEGRRMAALAATLNALARCESISDRVDLDAGY